MAALECWSGKPKPKSRSDEETVEQVLMRSHQRSESDTVTSSSSSSSSSSSITSSGMQKRFQKLSRNVSEAINSVKNTLNININTNTESCSTSNGSGSGSGSSTPRKVVWASIVRSLTQLYPGSQLPEKLVSNIRTHYDSLPLSYAQAGFDMKDVFLHIRLIEQASVQDHPAIVFQHIEGSGSGSGSVYVVSFASNSAVSWAAMSAALEASSLCCGKRHIFENKASTLAVLHFPQDQDPNFKIRVENALRSASKKPKFSNRKLSFGLCGCQQETAYAYARDFADVDADDDDDRLPDHAYRNSIDQSNANIQLTNPLPSSSLLVSVDEWQTVRGRGLEVDSWLLSCDAVEFTNQIGPTSFKGVYNAKRVAIEKLKGCDKGNAYDFEIRKDLLELMTCGHRNVLPFYGACIDDFHGLCVVTRFMEGGSVHGFMLKHKKIQIKDVVRIAIDIAEGLKFMNDHGVAYHDLNTQRIFLDRQGNACLGDMGIVRACKSGAETMEYETDGYRWLAPEIIAADPENVSETWMSNVYSFGMLVWEMINGEAAYSTYSPVQAAVGIAACGLRPDIPKDCPQLLKSLMVKCWNNCPSMRPQFSEILSVLLQHNSISLLKNR